MTPAGVRVAEAKADRVRGEVLPTVEVGADGHAVDVAWAPVPGATGVVVDAAEVVVAAAARVEQVADLPARPATIGTGTATNAFVVDVPPGRAVRSLTLQGLRAGGAPVETTNGDRRLVVSVPAPDGGWGPPLHAVPAVSGTALVPPTLTGASFSAGVLSFARDLAAPRVRLTVTSGEAPHAFAPLGLALDRVAAQLVAAPRDLSLTVAGGAVAWSAPGELALGAPPQTTDVRVPLEAALAARVELGAPPTARLELRAASPARARFRMARPRGGLVRARRGVLRVVLDGAPRPLPLDGPLAAEAPTHASADVRVTYDGLRLLPAVLDPVPVAGAAAGRVVGEEPAVRVLPPAALVAAAPARIGVVGRAPEPCELTVGLVDHATGRPGDALCDPVVLRLGASRDVAVHWAELPPLEAPVGPAAVTLRAGTGRFLWCGAPEGALRIAVADPDPGGAALTLGGRPLQAVTRADERTAGRALPAGAFRGPRPPLLDAPLLLTVELGDLTLRYER